MRKNRSGGKRRPEQKRGEGNREEEGAVLTKLFPRGGVERGGKGGKWGGGGPLTRLVSLLN